MCIHINCVVIYSMVVFFNVKTCFSFLPCPLTSTKVQLQCVFSFQHCKPRLVLGRPTVQHNDSNDFLEYTLNRNHSALLLILVVWPKLGHKIPHLQSDWLQGSFARAWFTLPHIPQTNQIAGNGLPC